METINYDEFAEKYSLDLLGKDEKVWFKKEMDQNPGLSEKVAFYKDLSAAIKEDDVLEFRAALNEVGKEYKVSVDRKRVRKLVIRIGVAAASFLLLIASVFVLLTLNHRHNSPIKVFAEFYNPYKSGVNFRSGTIVSDVKFERAVRYYDSGKYMEAQQVFDSILIANAKNNAALFYSGMVLIELKEYSRAETNFRKVIDQANSLYVQQAEWYRGLCLLVLNDRKNAIRHFSSLASGKGYYSAKAALVLKELNY